MRTDLYNKASRVLLITNVAFMLIIAGTLNLEARSITQTITLRVKDASLDKVFRVIEQQSGYYFVYNSAQIKQARPVTIDITHATLEMALSLCFKDQKFTYSIVENLVVVKSKDKLNPSVDYISEKGMSGDPLIEVRGRVTSLNGEPLPGVTVSVKGKKKATYTNTNGDFILSGIETTAILIFTGTSVETTSVDISGQRQILVKLAVRMSKLDEVQVIAYGTTTQRFSTGNVTTVSGEDIRKSPVSNPLLALEGRVPGLVLTQATGVPGGAVKVRVQGQNSITAGNNPLYVIDGVPYTAQMLPTVLGGVLGNTESSQIFSRGGSGNPLSYINPSDIESIEILKDADATSIYGSRAANGAILITTRKGKPGQAKVDCDFQQGWSKRTTAIKMMNTRQYLAMRNEAIRNSNVSVVPTDGNYDINGLWDTTRYTDWVKTLAGQDAAYMNSGLSIAGGNANAQYLIGGTYNRQTTPFSGNFSDKKASLHFNISANSQNQKLRLQFTGSYMSDNNKLPRTDPSSYAYLLAPDAPPVYKPDGNLNWAPNLAGNSSWANPLAQLENTYNNTTNNLTSNIQLNYKIFPDLTITGNFGYNKMQTNEVLAYLAVADAPESRTSASRYGQYTYSTITSFLAEPQISYRRMIGKGKLEMLLGATIQQNNSSGQSYEGYDFLTDALIKDIKSASVVDVSSTLDAVYKYNAGFGRLTYNLANKYIINLSARRDGSSRFGPENRFHDFASVAGAWIFSEENFFKNVLSLFSFGKLKASFGTTGSDQIGDYQFMDLYSSNTPPVPYQGTGGSLIVSGIPNPYLQWEETHKFSAGIDLGLRNDRVLLSVVYGRNHSSNQLLSYSLPSIAGFSGIYKNFPATIENTNWEISVNTINIKTRNFSWNTNINVTLPNNKLVDFIDLSTSPYRTTFIIGQPISLIRVYHFLGVNPATGLYTVSNSHGSATSTPIVSTDYTNIINTLPEYYGGIQNTITYKGFTVSFLFQFIKQVGKTSYFGFTNPPGTAQNNQPVYVIDNHWQKPGDNSRIQRYGVSGLFTPYNNAVTSDAAYTDASFVRLKNIYVSYSVPERWCQKLRMKDVRFFMQGQNLFTITQYPWGDPESQSTTNLPPLRTFVFGVHVTL